MAQSTAKKPTAKLTHVPLTTLPWERFADVVSPAQAEDLRRTVERARTVLPAAWCGM